MSNRHSDSHIDIPDDFLNNSLPARIGPYRSLSAKRLRDPTHRKSVSFNDVPIVYEVPSHDTMRTSNNDLHRSWTYVDPILPFSSSQVLLPFNSTSAAAQKMHAHRLSNSLYSSTSRLNDCPLRAKTIKPFDETIEQHPPAIIVHTPSEQTIYSENIEDKKPLYRSPIIPDHDHYRTLPFTYTPLSESTTTYTSMLTTNLSQSNSDQISNGYTRTTRVHSASLPGNLTDSSTRSNDNILLTPLRQTTNNSLSRTVLKPATIAFHGSSNTPTNTIIPKAPVIPPRSSSFTTHSRLISSSNRPLSSMNKHHSTSSTTLTRSRSAHILSSKRNTTSPVVMLDEQSRGSNQTNFYTTTKRNPNVKQTYGSYYIHPVLLPANMN